MKKLATIIILFFSGLILHAQSLSVTATITDSDGQTWNNGFWSVQIYSPNGAPYYNGTLVSTSAQSGTLSSSGVLSVTLNNTSTITPSGALYAWTICSKTSASCNVFQTPVTSSNLTTLLNNFLTAPRFPAGAAGIQYGYLDVEIQPIPAVGLGYYNVTNNVNRIWNGTTFISGGGGAMPANLTVVATDGSGNGVQATSVQIVALVGNAYATPSSVTTVVANGPAAPPLSNGLALWQRFTEAQGVAPVDYSGNGYVSTMPGGATNPTATAEGLVFSPSTSQYYTLPSAISALTTPTFMAVICQNNPTSTLGWSQPTFATSTSGSGLVLGLFGYGSIYSPNGETWAPSMGITTADFTPNFTPRTASSATEGDCRVVTWVPGAPDHIYVMEQEVAYGTPNGGGQNSSIAGAGIGSLQIGGGITNNHLTNGNFDGILRELFVYNRALTGNDLIRQVQNAKAIALQDGAPFVRTASSAVTSIVVCDGDSITAGAGVSNSYCTSSLFTPTETVTAQKVATAGRSLLAGASSAYTDLAPLVRPNAPHNTLLVYLGTNNSHESASQILAAYNKITGTGRQLGYKVVWAPMIARGNVDDANKNVVAPVLFANAPLMADGYLNWDTDPILGANGAALNTTYFQGDTVHPTQVGQNLMGVYWTNVYNKLWGSTETTPVTISTATRTLGASDSWAIVTANSTLTLPSCYGYAGFWAVKVNPGLTVTIKTALSAQTIDATDYSVSGLALTAGARTRFLVVPGAMTTGGCTWSQQ